MADADALEQYLREFEAAVEAPQQKAAEMSTTLREFIDAISREHDLADVLVDLGTPEEVARRFIASGGPHRHLDRIELPDRAWLWAASHSGGDYARPARPDWGLYFDHCWNPPWPHHIIEWPDFGLPDLEHLRTALTDVVARTRRGVTVEIGCLGGHGRTGTALASLVASTGAIDDPVAWVRAHYCERAVETAEQEGFARSWTSTLR